MEEFFFTLLGKLPLSNRVDSLLSGRELRMAINFHSILLAFDNTKSTYI